jgi:hypothetical protein
MLRTTIRSSLGTLFLLVEGMLVQRTGRVGLYDAGACRLSFKEGMSTVLFENELARLSLAGFRSIMHRFLTFFSSVLNLRFASNFRPLFDGVELHVLDLLYRSPSVVNV